MEYLTETLTTGKVKAICTIGTDKKSTYCMYTPHTDDWEPPCQMCSMMQFYKNKAHFFIYVAWKGTLLREEDEES